MEPSEVLAPWVWAPFAGGIVFVVAGVAVVVGFATGVLGGSPAG